MATQGIDYNKVFLDSVDDIHASINTILNNIRNHFKFHRPHKHYLSLSNRHFNRCYNSWSRLEPKLEEFFSHPRQNYTNVMWLIEHDLEKLPDNNMYTRELRKLAGILSQGPNVNHNKIKLK